MITYLNTSEMSKIKDFGIKGLEIHQNFDFNIGKNYNFDNLKRDLLDLKSYNTHGQMW